LPASYDFVQLDVFTRTALTGNPLAVFIDGRGLTDEEMQAEFRRQKLLGPSYSRAKPLALKFFDVQSHLLWYLPRQRCGLAQEIGRDGAQAGQVA